MENLNSHLKPSALEYVLGIKTPKPSIIAIASAGTIRTTINATVDNNYDLFKSNSATTESTNVVNPNWFEDVKMHEKSILSPEPAETTFNLDPINPDGVANPLKPPTTFLSPHRHVLKRLFQCTVIFASLAILLMTIFSLIFFGELNKMPTYLQPCSASNPCNTISNLFCNGTCICSSAYYWNGTFCTTLLTYGTNCTSVNQCASNYLCWNSICQCSNTTKLVSGFCQ